MGTDTMTEMMAGNEHRGTVDGQTCLDGYEDMGGAMGQAMPGMRVSSMMSEGPGPDGP